MAEGRSTVAVDEAIHGKPAEPVHELRFRRGGAVDVLAPSSLAVQDTLLVQAAHDGHDRRVRVVPMLTSAQAGDDVGDARLAPAGHVPHDRRREWPEHVFEVGRSVHNTCLPPSAYHLGASYYGRVVYLPAMGPLLADEPLPILEGIALLAAALVLLLASVARAWAHRPDDRVAQVFWRDVSQAGYVWAATTIAIVASALLEVEGLRVPIWLFLSLMAGLACLVIVRLRRPRLALRSGRPPADDPSRPDRQALVSTTWEVATLSGGGGALLLYALSLSHAWGHPIHWLVGGIGGAIGYVVGLVSATPRFTVRRYSR